MTGDLAVTDLVLSGAEGGNDQVLDGWKHFLLPDVRPANPSALVQLNVSRAAIVLTFRSLLPDDRRVSTTPIPLAVCEKFQRIVNLSSLSDLLERVLLPEVNLVDRHV